ncbi:sigma factor-like helix-turn-helix DNA-binding protein [Pimelobacter simplex]|uniref:sigma factor-like helix-turn-helix DNA-binding protein n=1 Tax=Nocardioides simplex TaxID=2045 RepID=UPI00366D52B7
MTADVHESPSSPQPRSARASGADHTAGFDDFYRDSRDRLLLQTFALTGDLAAARSAVREAFVVSWHHWRKTGRLDDPEMAVRPDAWRKALRRSTARPWHRKKDIAAEHRAILDALAALSVDQRKALLLTQLAAVSMDEMAQEIGLPLEAAERELQQGAAAFATELAIPTSAIPLSLSSLGAAIRSVTWPRVTIIRRAGAARRRAHTVIGGAAAVVALVAGGAVAHDATGDRPTLDRADVPAATSTPRPPGPAVTTLPDTALLPVDVVQEALPGRGWQQGTTTDNSSGNGLVLPCQTERYADPQGTSAWVRTFRNSAKPRAARSVVQLAEASSAEPRAIRTYRRALRWFTTCPTPAEKDAAPPRVQLVSTATLPGVGDQSALVVLRSRADGTTYVVGVARTGLYTTVTSLSAKVAPGQPGRVGVAQLLATAVGRMCANADGGACAPDKPKVVDRAPYRTGDVPWMLSELDLPPLTQDPGPWVGTPAAKLTEDRIDSGAVGCDTVHLFGKFRNQPVKDNQFRTFVLSDAKLPPEVGLTQTVGTLPTGAARAFVQRFREQMAACPDVDATAGTEVEQLAQDGDALSAWHLSTALPGDRTVEYDVAVLRRGTSVSVLVYVAAPRARMANPDFVALARRSVERLAVMGTPTS